MKRSIIVLYLLVSPLILDGQVQYKVNLSRDSMIYNKELGKYEPLSSSTIVNLTDTLRIDKNGSIEIFEISTGKPQAYKNVKSGKMTVENLVYDCMETHRNPLKSLLKYLSPMTAQRDGSRYGLVGSSSRGEGYNSIVSLLRRDLMENNNVTIDDKLQLVKHVDGSIFTPEFVNNTNDTLHVNFLAIDKSNNTIRVCYIVAENDSSYSVVLPPNSRHYLQGVYYLDSPQYQFVVFGTTEPINSYEINKELIGGGNDSILNSESQINVKYGKILEEQ
jgi:hypothetical protein